MKTYWENRSIARYYMEVSGQIHPPAALPPGKELPPPPVSIGEDVGWTPEPVSTRWRGKTSLSLPGIESRSSSLYPSHLYLHKCVGWTVSMLWRHAVWNIHRFQYTQNSTHAEISAGDQAVLWMSYHNVNQLFVLKIGKSFPCFLHRHFEVVALRVCSLMDSGFESYIRISTVLN